MTRWNSYPCLLASRRVLSLRSAPLCLETRLLARGRASGMKDLRLETPPCSSCRKTRDWTVSSRFLRARFDVGFMSATGKSRERHFPPKRRSLLDEVAMESKTSLSPSEKRRWESESASHLERARLDFPERLSRAKRCSTEGKDAVAILRASFPRPERGATGDRLVLLRSEPFSSKKPRWRFAERRLVSGSDALLRSVALGSRKALSVSESPLSDSLVVNQAIWYQPRITICRTLCARRREAPARRGGARTGRASASGAASPAGA